MSDNVVVLNADYTFLSVTSWKNAVCLLIEGKAETLKETTKIVRNFDRTVEITIPLYIRVVKYVRKIFKQKVPFSKRNVFVRDDQTCQFCGTYIEDINDCTVDHVTPRAQGGKSKWVNCVTACKPCNHRKADRTPTQAKMYLKRRPVQPTINEYIKYFTKKYGIDELLKSL
jgi:5-methylcytosine-specific restriction endonuclease McrA